MILVQKYVKKSAQKYVKKNQSKNLSRDLSKKYVQKSVQKSMINICSRLHYGPSMRSQEKTLGKTPEVG